MSSSLQIINLLLCFIICTLDAFFQISHFLVGLGNILLSLDGLDL